MDAGHQKVRGQRSLQQLLSGSYVSYLGHYAAMLPGRIRNLATEEDSPDMILIYTGINDVANDIPLDAFQRDYTDMLQKIHRFHPGLRSGPVPFCMGQAPSSGRPYYIEPEHFQNIDAYNTVIRTCVKAEHAHLVDLAAHGVTYETVNGLHPQQSGNGHLCRRLGGFNQTADALIVVKPPFEGRFSLFQSQQ